MKERISMIVLVLATCTAGPVKEQVQGGGTVQEKRPHADKLLPLPIPTGLNPVGTTVLHLTDESRRDVVSKNPGEFREIMVQVWYPSASKSGPRTPYLPDPSLLRTMMTRGYYGQDASTLAQWRDIRTHSVWNAPVQPGHRFPLILFSPGLGITRSNYTAFAEELASHGFVVAGIDSPYLGLTVLPNGRVLSVSDDPSNESEDEGVISTHLALYVSDAAFVVRELEHPRGESPVNLSKAIAGEKIGMFGHSLGGAAALETCRAHLRFSACADLDGAPFGRVLHEGARKPTLLLLESPDYTDADLAAKGRTREQWEAMGRKNNSLWAALGVNRGVPVYKVKIRGTGHLSFSDAPFVMPSTITEFGGRILDAQTTFNRITTYLLAFFDQYLRGKASVLLTRPTSPYAEVTFERLGAGSN